MILYRIPKASPHVSRGIDPEVRRGQLVQPETIREHFRRGLTDEEFDHYLQWEWERVDVDLPEPPDEPTPDGAIEYTASLLRALRDLPPDDSELQSFAQSMAYKWLHTLVTSFNYVLDYSVFQPYRARNLAALRDVLKECSEKLAREYPPNPSRNVAEPEPAKARETADDSDRWISSTLVMKYFGIKSRKSVWDLVDNGNPEMLHDNGKAGRQRMIDKLSMVKYGERKGIIWGET